MPSSSTLRPPRPGSRILPGFRGAAGRPPHRRLAAWLSRNRRLIVALLLCAAAGLAVQQLTPAPAATVAALAAARDLPAGAVLDSSDVAVVAVPPGLIPDGSHTGSAGFPGGQLAVALRQGQLLNDSQFVGSGLLAGSPPGSAAVPLRMADPASIRLVAPGQLVNIILTLDNSFDQTAESQVLAAGVPVLWTSTPGDTPGLWSDSGETDGLIVVAAGADQARQLAGASTRGKLFFVLVGAAAPG